MINLKLAALMSSKLCHDIIGPVGAINNGIELLADENNADMRDQAMELVSQSAGEAGARLQFYRLAFGLAGGMGAEVSLRDARNLSRAFMTYSKVELDWPDHAGGAENMSKDAIKVICNLVAIASGALPRGGKLAISGQVDDAGWNFEFRASGPRAGLREDITSTILEGYDEDSLTAQNVGAQYMMALCQNNNFSLLITAMEDELAVLQVKSN
ncbi:MAG: hypothetical protein JKX94_08150 [Sneathiella sp.]|nr:hypothetical protein [Sneathiella sp.]